MSKSPNIFLPAVGVTSLVLAGALGLATKNYKDSEIQALEAQVATISASAEAARAEAEKLRQAAAEAEAKAAELSAKVEELAKAPAPAPAPPAITAAAAQGDAAPEGVSLALGRPALPEEVAAWDTDVRPDGLGLPEGSGDVLTGEEVFVENCAVCHGDFGEGVGRWPVLAGGFGTLNSENPVKTVGSYWPYLSTVYDYVHRAMPFGNAKSLTDDEVYALTAYILYLNDIVDEDFELTRENFTEVKLPNEPNFFPDDRLETEFPAFSKEPCMENCKETVEITARARVIDVTPDDTGKPAEEETVTQAAVTSEEPATEPVTEPASTEPAATEAPVATEPDPELVAAGEKAFRRCKSCHQIGEGAKNRTGPALNGVVGRHIGSIEGFKYSDTFKAAAEAGEVWTPEKLKEFLTNPKQARPGTRMNFAGVKSEADIEALIAYLQAAGG